MGLDWYDPERDMGVSAYVGVPGVVPRAVHAADNGPDTPPVGLIEVVAIVVVIILALSTLIVVVIERRRRLG
jgi:hypothetical protein